MRAQFDEGAAGLAAGAADAAGAAAAGVEGVGAAAFDSGATAALAPSAAGLAAGLSLKSVAYQPVPLSAKPAAVSCLTSLG